MANVKKDDLQALPWLMCGSVPPTDDKWFSKEERSFAKGLFSRLGTTDLDGQLRHLEQYAVLAEQAETEARDRRNRLTKAYVTTGLCAGLCLGIMLL